VLTVKDEEKHQLGMDKGTAGGRLRKLLLFEFARRLGLLTCIRCRKPIELVNDFTTDHIKPWFHIDPSLFWDLNNVGFSHDSCNKRAGRKNTEAQRLAKTGERSPMWGKPSPRRMNGPLGTAFCFYKKHRAFIDISNFNKDKKRWNGLAPICRICLKSKKDKR
jgi:hypothetical protein